MLNEGIQKEYEFANALNNQHLEALPPHTQLFIKTLFSEATNSELITAKKIEEYIKPDFSITMNGVTKYVSLKSGTAKVVHQENIKKFVQFLRKNDISEETINTLLLFHYGDGTTDGSGIKRHEYAYLIYHLKHKLEKANVELNSDKSFVLKCMDRFLFIGTNPASAKVDVIYHGDEQYGVFINFNQLKKHIAKRDWHYIQNPHIGPLHLKPHARYFDGEIKNPIYRELVDVYWVNMRADMEYIASKYRF